LATPDLESSRFPIGLKDGINRPNPWAVGGVSYAAWEGIWLKDVLAKARLKAGTRHIAFEGFDKPLGSAQIQLIRSIPLEKAMSSTLPAYEMNGEPQPVMLTNTQDKFDIKIKVLGGGIMGQAGAIRHGITRFLMAYDSDRRPTLKKELCILGPQI